MWEKNVLVPRLLRLYGKLCLFHSIKPKLILVNSFNGADF